VSGIPLLRRRIVATEKQCSIPLLRRGARRAGWETSSRRKEILMNKKCPVFGYTGHFQKPIKTNYEKKLYFVSVSGLFPDSDTNLQRIIRLKTSF